MISKDSSLLKLPSWVSESYKGLSSRLSPSVVPARLATPSALASFVRSSAHDPVHVQHGALRSWIANLSTSFIDQARKRGTLESDLLMSTFAATHLSTMTPSQLDEFDLLLDENDWDLYYWATQRETSSSTNPSTDNPAFAESSASATDPSNADDVIKREPPKGEWAQTVGNFRPAYRPVPQRWRDSEILELLRQHVRSRSVDGGEGGGMAFMPSLDAQK